MSSMRTRSEARRPAAGDGESTERVILEQAHGTRLRARGRTSATAADETGTGQDASQNLEFRAAPPTPRDASEHDPASVSAAAHAAHAVDASANGVLGDAGRNAAAASAAPARAGKSGRKRRQPNPWDDQQEEALHFLLKPHTLTGLALLIFVALYGALLTPNPRMEDNVKAGLLACYVVLLLFAALQFRDGIFFRPNPVLWRLVLATCLVYELAVVLFMYQQPHHGRHLMSLLDPRLGKPIQMRSYAVDCRVFTPEHPESSIANIKDVVWDRFMVAHLLGWWGKTVIIRDPVVVWFLSVTFEFLEMSFQELLPNFRECWWDHWILDVFGMNLLGIYLGYKTLGWLEAKPYTFVGLNQTVGLYPKAKRVFWQFSPMSWTTFRWEMFRSPRRCLMVWFLAFLVLLMDCNAFFLKHVLWVPPDSPLNSYRLCLMAALGAQGIAEYHEYISNDKVKRMGAASWLCIAISLSELLVVLKYSPGQYPGRIPGFVWSIWLTFFSMVAGWYYFYFFLSKSHLKAYPDDELVAARHSVGVSTAHADPTAAAAAAPAPVPSRSS